MIRKISIPNQILHIAVKSGEAEASTTYPDDSAFVGYATELAVSKHNNDNPSWWPKKMNPHFNSFELRFFDKVTDAASADHRAILLWQQIWVDGVAIDEPHPINLLNLIRSLYRPGVNNIFTCGCGSPGCARIEEGVYVRHEPGVIRWGFRRPVSYESWLDREPDLDHVYDLWKKEATWVEYCFSRAQMLNAIDLALDSGRRIVAAASLPVECSPYGFDTEALNGVTVQSYPRGFGDDSSRRELFFFADQEPRLLLDGEFHTASSLGVREDWQSLLGEWAAKANSNWQSEDGRMDWLDEARGISLEMYRIGLNSDIDAFLVFGEWTDKGVESWSQTILAVPRDWLETERAIDGYLCLSSGKDGYSAWLDDQPEPRNFRANFCGYSSTGFHGRFMVPFTLEKAIYSWGNQLQVVEDFTLFDWDSFNREGQRLASCLKGIVGNRCPVLYERPWENRSEERARRIEVA